MSETVDTYIDFLPTVRQELESFFILLSSEKKSKSTKSHIMPTYGIIEILFFAMTFFGFAYKFKLFMIFNIESVLYVCKIWKFVAMFYYCKSEIYF